MNKKGLYRLLDQEKPDKVRAVRLKKSDGMRGLIDTVDLLILMGDYYKKKAEIRHNSLIIFKEEKGDLSKIFQRLSSIVQYIPDIYGIETVQSPLYTLKFGGGDCDDLALLSYTVLSAVGFNCRYVLAGRGGGYSHIFIKVKHRGKDYIFDLTKKNFNMVNTGYNNFKEF